MTDNISELHPRWMKLKQACRYASMGKESLLELVKSNKINGFQDKTLKTKQWIIDKESIDKYRTKQFFEAMVDSSDDFEIDFSAA